MQWISLAFGSLVVLLTVHGADGMQCYTCAILGCGDTFDPDSAGVTKTDCTGSCMKTITGETVARACVPSVKTDECKSEVVGTVCTCTGDLCNAGTRIAFPILLMGILALVPRIM